MLGVARHEREQTGVLKCPGCGYEVGRAGTERRTAPTGVCSECGRTFLWSEVENPSLRELAWFVEHGREWGDGEKAWRVAWALATRAIATFWRVITLGLWRAVSLDVRVSVQRMLLWCIVVIGGMHAIASLLSMGRVAWLLRGSWGPGAPAGSLTTSGFVQQLATCWVYPVIEGFEWWASGARSLSALAMWSYMGWPTEVIAAIVGHTAAAAIALSLIASRRRLGVRGVHVFRAWVYGWAWLVVLGGFRAVRNLVLLAGVVWEKSVGTAIPVASGGTQVRFGGAKPFFVSDLPIGVLWAVTCGWLAAWWLVTVKQGWRVEQPVRFWLAIAVPGALAGGAAAVWRDGYYWYW